MYHETVNETTSNLNVILISGSVSKAIVLYQDLDMA